MTTSKKIKSSISLILFFVISSALISSLTAEYNVIIGDAFRSVDRTGVVMMETTEDNETSVEIVEGVEYDKGLVNSHFITSKTKNAE